MSWIKFEFATLDKPEIYQLAELLHVSENEVIGACVRLWVWADINTVDGSAKVTRDVIDRVGRISGFANALVRCGWLTIDRAKVSCQHFDRHNGTSAKRRALSALRSSKYRAKLVNAEIKAAAQASRSARDGNVTRASPEKIREDNTIPPPLPPLPSGRGDARLTPQPRKPLPDVAAARKSNGRWWLDKDATLRKGEELGKLPHRGESPTAYLARLREEIANRRRLVALTAPGNSKPRKTRNT
jgi:hypothetical protein